MRKITLTFLFCLLCLQTVFAQAADCPTIVKAALDAVGASCADTSRNQLCYGNVTLSATPRAGVTTLNFEKAGDRTNINDVQSLQLSSMSVTDDTWGVALMELQANLPDTLPGQNVKFLLFGDVQIDNKTTDETEIRMNTSRNVNVRLRPNTTSNNIIASLKSGASVIATGRLADSSWVRIKVQGDTSRIGWVAADFISGDVSKLGVVKTDTTTWGPMQSFYFKSGVGDRPCEQAPDSGILIQTPKGSGKVTLNVNNVEIKLGSTVYLQAQPNNLMTVTVVEGQATLEAGGQTQIVPAGTFSQVSLDTTGSAIGVPSYPKPYNENTLQTLPLTVNIFDPVVIATPLTTAQIKSALGETTVSKPTTVPAKTGTSYPSGTWTLNYEVTVNTPGCGESEPLGLKVKAPLRLTFSDDSQQMVQDDGWSGIKTLTRIGDNVYQGTFGALTLKFTFTSQTTFDYSHQGLFGDPNQGGCHHILVGNGVFTG